MRIEFDTGNTEELQAIAALIAVLRGDNQLHQDVANAIADHNDRASDLPGQSDIVRPTPAAPTPPAPVAPAAPAPEHVPDPAAAFGGVSAEQAFAPNAPAPDAPAPSVGDGAGAASSAPLPTPPAGVDVDKEGLPWDSRIHSTPAAKTAKDVWRAKRNLDPAVKASVSAELLRAMAAPAVAGAPVPPPPPPAAGTVPPPPPPAATAPTPVPPAPPPTPAVADTASGTVAATTAASPPPPPPPAASGPMTFADLMRKITGMQTSGKLTVEQTQEISKSLEIDGVRNLMQRPDLIPAFDALLPDAA